MSEITLAREFLPHRRTTYVGQVASCGCWRDSLTGTDHVGELCDRRLTGPRCQVDGCERPSGHAGGHECSARNTELRDRKAAP